jgi:hypothetical protein
MRPTPIFKRAVYAYGLWSYWCREAGLFLAGIGSGLASDCRLVGRLLLQLLAAGGSKLMGPVCEESNKSSGALERGLIWRRRA